MVLILKGYVFILNYECGYYMKTCKTCNILATALARKGLGGDRHGKGQTFDTTKVLEKNKLTQKNAERANTMANKLDHIPKNLEDT